MNDTGKETMRDNANSESNLQFRNWQLIGAGGLLICCLFLLYLSVATVQQKLGPGPIYKGNSVTAWIDSIQT